MKETIEKRTVKTELRVIRKEDGALPKIEGYAAVFNSDSADMGFIERIKPGAFKDAIGKSDVRSLFNHDPNFVLGRVKSGTLVLKEDKNGLLMTTNPPDTQLIRDMVLTPIERGDIDQQSFGFTIEKDSWDKLDTDTPVRTIEKVRELFDVSVVTYPAYPETSVALRSLAEARGLKNDEISVEVDSVTHTFKDYDEFDLVAEQINELRQSISPLAAVQAKTESSPSTPDSVVVETEDNLLTLIRKIEKDYKNEDNNAA